MVAPWKNCLQSGWLLHQSLNLLARQMSQNGPHIAHDRITKQHETKSNKIKQRQHQTASNNHNNHALPGIIQVMTLYVPGNPELHSTGAKFGGIPTWRTSSAMSVVSFRLPAQDKHQGNCTSDNWEGSKCYGISCRIKPFGLRVSHPLLVVTVQNHSEKFKCLTSHPLHWAQVIRQAPAQKAAHEEHRNEVCPPCSNGKTCHTLSIASLKACAARFPAKVATVRPFPPATSRKACRSSRREILPTSRKARNQSQRLPPPEMARPLKVRWRANYSMYVAKNDYHYSCRQTLQLCVGRVSPGYQCRYSLTHPAKIFKKTGTLMILICADYSVQVFKIRSVLCREQSGVYVAITMDQLLHNPPLGKGG